MSDPCATAEAVARALVRIVRDLPEDDDAVELLAIFVEERLARPEERR